MDGSGYLHALEDNADTIYAEGDRRSAMISRLVSDGSGPVETQKAILGILETYRRTFENDHSGYNSEFVICPSLVPLLHQSRTIYSSRRKRASFLDQGLFGEPAWDILLDLLISLLEGKRTTVSSCCIASACPTTTGLRWIGQLEKRGLVERLASDTDKRSTYVVLTKEGALGVAKCVGSISGCE